MPPQAEACVAGGPQGDGLFLRGSAALEFPPQLHGRHTMSDDPASPSGEKGGVKTSTDFVRPNLWTTGNLIQKVVIEKIGIISKIS